MLTPKKSLGTLGEATNVVAICVHGRDGVHDDGSSASPDNKSRDKVQDNNLCNNQGNKARMARKWVDPDKHPSAILLAL